jgi:ribonuclease P protein component
LDSFQNFSFTKKNRILNKSDFENLKTNSSVFNFKEFKIIYKKNESKGRLGLITTRRCGPSVERNLYKRMTREFFRKSSLKTLPYDFIFLFGRKVDGDFKSQELKNKIQFGFLKFEEHLSKIQ